MSGSGREALSDVRECSDTLQCIRKRLGGPPGCLGVVERPLRMSRSGRDGLLNVRERSVGPPEWPGVIGRPYRMTGCQGVFGRPSRMSGSCQYALPNF